jgi:hypothetical protein
MTDKKRQNQNATAFLVAVPENLPVSAPLTQREVPHPAPRWANRIAPSKKEKNVPPRSEQPT